MSRIHSTETILTSSNPHKSTDQNSNNASQLQDKLAAFKQALTPFFDGPISVFESSQTGYRMRTEFRIWHEGDEIHYAMHHPGTKELYFVERFPAATIAIQTLMPVLKTHLAASEVLRQRLFSIEFLSSQSGDMLVTLIYHKPLGDDWSAEAINLKKLLQIELIGRSKKQKVVLNQDYVTETLVVEGKDFRYRQFENSFTQPNAAVNEKMLSWACQQAQSMGKDLLELYCGNGNFTLPLAQYFDKVLATEVSKVSIQALKWNLTENAITNIDYARLSAEEITTALDRTRPFRRLAHVDLDAYEFETVFVDPPRAGVDQKTLQLLSRFKNIIYISCNPITLIDNIANLASSHEVTAAAAFDQFPYTSHLETGLILQKRIS